ncbi:LysR family transcriptional regulator [Bradyrhizobium centrolobii]|uniref:LysR family transcriptional regulator n=1 Tax=Bradyrhizobium centrolobii TaxID=1505087 RepID=A0A176YGT9_9BRAD|nr:LysR family transcriptional regulator [Bradyrhizobium centrolobii]OAF05410.1 LysR family transcriptional regulator [Bradyrhizobium centrolobii]
MSRGRLIELEATVAVARRRSFRAAAAELGLSSTALSQAIAELEARLGVRLFNRTTRSVSPTPAGEQFVAQVAPALTAIRDAADAVNQHRSTPTGVLRLNTSAGAARRILRPIVFEYLKRYPEMSVDIVTEGKLIDIVREGFDAGFRLAEQVPADMISIPLGRDERLVVVGSPAYLAGRALPTQPADLARHDCIRMRLPAGAVYRWEFEKEGEQLVDVSGRLTLDDAGLIREAALAGYGVAYMSEWDVADDLHEGRLVQLLADWTPPFPGVCLYYPGRRHVPAGLRAFIDLIQERRRQPGG